MSYVSRADRRVHRRVPLPEVQLYPCQARRHASAERRGRADGTREARRSRERREHEGNQYDKGQRQREGVPGSV